MTQSPTAGNRTPALKRSLGIVAGVCLALGLALVASPATAAPGDEHLAGLEYVALGDSYASGFGLTPITNLPAPECAQATQNYPHQVADELGLTLTDVSCSGAETANLTTTPQPVAVATTVPIQNAALSETTEIVSVTIGGIDLGYVDILTNCAAISPAGPVVAGTTTCEEFYNPGGVDSLAAAIDGPVTTALVSTFAAIAAAAPNATIFVVGYPALTPSTIPDGGCFRDAVGAFTPPFPENAYPFTDVDVAYLHTVEVRFDEAIADAAEIVDAAVPAEVTYLSSLADTYAHSGCATEDSYIEGITLTGFIPGAPPTIELAPGAMHPNAAGVGYLAGQLQNAIRAAFPAPEVPDDPDTAGDLLPATGTDASGTLIITSLALLLAGGFAVLLRRTVSARARS